MQRFVCPWFWRQKAPGRVVSTVWPLVKTRRLYHNLEDGISGGNAGKEAELK